MSAGAGTAFQHVIVGVDGRQGGRDAIAMARLLVSPTGRLTLAHVRVGGFFPGGAPHAASDAAAVATEAAKMPPGELGAEGSQAVLEQERATADVEAGVISVLAASVGRGLHQLAESAGADLLAVGSSHRGFLGRVFVGDDTRASLNGAPCAVAVAPLAYAQDLHGLRTIGVGYDGLEESKAALALAQELAARGDARARALQVVEMPGSFYAGMGGVAWGQALEKALEGAKQEMAALPGVEGDAVLGLAGEELAAFGSQVDLLVVGSRAYGPLRRLMLGSTSHYLAGHARCLLLVLPRGVGAESETRMESAAGAQSGG
jgi:nucleotide-binding universal stress UspA family protein